MSTLTTGGLVDELLGSQDDTNNPVPIGSTTNVLVPEETTNTRIISTRPSITEDVLSNTIFTSEEINIQSSLIGPSRISTNSFSLINEENTLTTEATRTVGQSILSSISSTPISSLSLLSNSISSSTGIITSLTGTSTRSSSSILSSSSFTRILSRSQTDTEIKTDELISTSDLSSSTSISSTSSSTSSISTSTSSTSSSIDSTSEKPTSTSEQPTETSPPVIVTISAGKNVTLTSSIYSTPPASITNSNNASKEAANDNDNTSILNTENKLFPLGVILVVVGSIIAFVTILWFLMKVFGITRRRQRLRGAIPSFVPPERIDFPDEKFDPYSPPAHHHQGGYVDYNISNHHQRNGSESSWNYLNNFDGNNNFQDERMGNRSITPAEAGLAGLGSNQRNYSGNEFVPDLPPQGIYPINANGEFVDPSQGNYNYDEEIQQGGSGSYLQQQYNPFMIESHSTQNQSGDLLQRGNSGSSTHSGGVNGLGRQISLNRNDAYGGVEVGTRGHERSLSNSSQNQVARLGKLPGGYV